VSISSRIGGVSWHDPRISHGNAMTLAPDTFAALLARLEIAHQTPGRVRLKLKPALAGAPLSFDKNGLLRFFARLETLPGIVGVRPNLLAKSCVIEYDKTALPDTLWREALAADATPAANAFRKRLYAAASGEEAR
jgi:hypothetical protein